MTARRWSPPLSIALLTAFVALGSAQAVPIPNAVFTPDGPVAFAITGASGTVDPYDLDTEGFLESLYGTDVVCLDGACSDPNDFSNQDWMVFRVTVSSGSLDQVTIGALFEASSGLGYFTSLGGDAPTSGDSTSNPNSPEWLFAGASLTSQSVPLIAVFDAGDLPHSGPFGAGATNFDLRLGGSSDQFLGFVNTPIPEPSTALLLALGLLGVGARRGGAPRR